MKKLGILFVLVFALAVVFVSCDGGGDDDTDIAWKNGDETLAINDIIWDADSIHWNVGYAPLTTSESKRVNTLVSSITCDWETLGPVPTIIDETSSSSADLSKGNSYVFTLVR